MAGAVMLGGTAFAADDTGTSSAVSDPTPTPTPTPAPTPTPTPAPVPGWHPGWHPGLPGDPALFCAVGFHRVGGVCVPNGVGLPGHVGGVWGPGHWGGHLGGHLIVLDGGPTLDVCGYTSYPVFVSHYSAYRARIDGLLGVNPAARWVALRGGCAANTVVIPNGLTLVNGSYLNLGAYGVVGLNTVNVCNYGSWNAFNGLYGARLTRFGPLHTVFGPNPVGVWNSLRVRARCQAVVVPGSVEVPQVQVQTDDPAPVVSQAPSSGSSGSSSSAPAQSYSAPSSGSGVVSSAPSVAPATGDGSLAG